MPRRLKSEEIIAIKKEQIEECPSLDLSFCDDKALIPGIIFTDLAQRKWRLGKAIGCGSFGRIYLTSDDVVTEVTKSNARYVVKVEPHDSGPLFVEIHCLIQTGKTEKVKAWSQQHGLKNLGIPHFVASGSFTDKDTGIKYRFLVLPRYDMDLQKVISKNKFLEPQNILIIAIQVLNVLEYLHSQGYTHSDIKSSNLMLGFEGHKFKVQDKSLFQQNIKSPVTFKKQLNKAKNNKYYDDDDFTIGRFDNKEKRIAKMRQEITKILTLKSRNILRHHAFNLRQLNNVNYEDINSLCSDRSYQKDFKVHDDVTKHQDLNEVYKEAIISQSKGQIYLLDYGIATKFIDSDGNHKSFCMDARKAHDGTLEYSSRDSHVGAHSRRSDLETLGFNLLEWLTGMLPWKSSEILAEPDLVHAFKTNFMNDIESLLQTCFKTNCYPLYLEKFLYYITTLEFTEKPDYDYCRSLFQNELVKSGHIFDKEYMINFEDVPKLPFKRQCYAKHFPKKNTPRNFSARNGVKKPYQNKKLIFSLEDAIEFDILNHVNISSDEKRKQYFSKKIFSSDTDLAARLKNSLMPHLLGRKLSPKTLRSKKSTIAKRKGIKRNHNSIGKFGNFMGSERQFTWAEILARNPEDILRKQRTTQTEEFDDDSTCKYRIRNVSSSSDNSDYQSPLLQNDYLEGRNPTNAMREVVANFKKKVAAKVKITDENNTKANLRLKCETSEKFDSLPESPTTKRFTRSMYRKTLDQVHANTETEPVRVNHGMSKSNGHTIQSIQIENSKQTKDFIAKKTRIRKTVQKQTKAVENLPEDNKKLSVQLVRKSLPRTCKDKKSPETEKKDIANNTIVPYPVSSERRKCLSIVLEKLDYKYVKQTPRKSPKRKIMATNRRRLRSDSRKKITLNSQ